MSRDRRDLLAMEAWDAWWRSASGASPPAGGLKGFLARHGDFQRLIISELRRAGAFSGRGPYLEAGHGSAGVLSAVARSGVQCVGLDTSMAACRMARARGLPAVRGSVTELPFKDGVFASAGSTGVLDQLCADSVLRSLSELDRVVRPGGPVVVVSNSDRSSVHRMVMVRLLSQGRWPWGIKSSFRSLRDEVGETLPGAVVEERELGWLLQWRFLEYLLPEGLPRKAVRAASLVLNTVLWPLNGLPGMVLVTVFRRDACGPAPAEGGSPG